MFESGSQTRRAIYSLRPVRSNSAAVVRPTLSASTPLQSAEKYLKAFLVYRGLDFPKTHDLEALAARLRNEKSLGVSPDDLAALKRYATVTRYPGEEEIPLSEARRAVAASKRLRNAIRIMLPQSAKSKT